jgi:hypothetical protein
MNELIYKVLSWANDRDLIDGGDSKSQLIKLMSEVGELADSINKKNDVEDDIGDCLVVLTIIAAQHNTTLEDCLAVAYNDIKDRQGVMLDGVFIKSTDPHYDHALAVIGARRASL